MDCEKLCNENNKTGEASCNGQCLETGAKTATATNAVEITAERVLDDAVQRDVHQLRGHRCTTNNNNMSNSVRH